VLIGLLSTIYARILPGLEVSDLRMFVGIALFVVINAAISIAVARRAGSREGLAAAFGARVVVNVGLVLLARLLLGGGALDLSATVFFVLLISLLVTYHDRFSPVAAVRAEHDHADPEPAPQVTTRA
jgi:fatty acid desaturase